MLSKIKKTQLRLNLKTWRLDSFCFLFLFFSEGTAGLFTAGPADLRAAGLIYQAFSHARLEAG